MSQKDHTSPRVWTYVVVRGDASHEDGMGLEGEYLLRVSMPRPLPQKDRPAALSAQVAEAVLDCFHDHQGIEVLGDFEISGLLTDGQYLEQADRARLVGEAAVVLWATSASKAPTHSRCLDSRFSKGAS